VQSALLDRLLRPRLQVRNGLPSTAMASAFFLDVFLGRRRLVYRRLGVAPLDSDSGPRGAAGAQRSSRSKPCKQIGAWNRIRAASEPAIARARSAAYAGHEGMPL
jgi:hypothetical protein